VSPIRSDPLLPGCWLLVACCLLPVACCWLVYRGLSWLAGRVAVLLLMLPNVAIRKRTWAQATK